MIFLLIIALVFFQTPFFNTFSIGDLALLIFNSFYFLQFKKIPEVILKKEFFLFAFIIWIIISIFLINDFNLSTYLNRFFRLSVVFLSYFCIQSYFHFRPIKIMNLPRYILILNFLIIGLIIIEFISTLYGDKIDFRLTYRELELNSYRIRSIFTEPSILSIFLVCISLFILKYANESNNLKYYKAIIAMVLAIFFALNQFNLKFNERLDRIIDNEDNSANQRVLGSWAASHLLSNNIYYGNGLGHESQIKHLKIDIDNFSKLNPKLNNSFAVFYYENGLIGLFLILGFILSKFRMHKYLVFFAIFFCFSHGSYFYAIFWVALALLKLNYKPFEKKIIKNISSNAVFQ